MGRALGADEQIASPLFLACAPRINPATVQLKDATCASVRITNITGKHAFRYARVCASSPRAVRTKLGMDCLQQIWHGVLQHRPRDCCPSSLEAILRPTAVTGRSRATRRFCDSNIGEKHHLFLSCSGRFSVAVKAPVVADSLRTGCAAAIHRWTPKTLDPPLEPTKPSRCGLPFQSFFMRI